jgi:hypothetical protein
VSLPGKVALAALLALAAVSLAGGRVLRAPSANDAVRLLRDASKPEGVVCGLLHGSPAQPGWQEAAETYAERPELLPLLLLALSREGELAPRTRAWLTSLATEPQPGLSARETSLARMLATFALERPEGGR